MNETPRPSDVPPAMIVHIRPWDKWPDFPKINVLTPVRPCATS